MRSVRPEEAFSEELSNLSAHTALPQSLAEAVVPAPLRTHEACRVLARIAGGYAIVLFSLAVVHIPLIAALNTPDGRRAAALLWSHLLESDLGLGLVYGALVTLFCYSERAFEHGGAGAYVWAVTRAVGWSTILLAAQIQLSGGGTITAGMLIAAAMLTIATFSGVHLLTARIRAGRAAELGRNVLIVGTGKAAREIARYLSADTRKRRVIKGFIGGQEDRACSIVGIVSDLGLIARAQFVDEVIIATGGDRELAARAVAESLRNHLDISIVPDLLEQHPSKLSVEAIGPVPLIAIHEEPIPWLGLLIKRGLDVVLSGIALLVALPVMTGIALLIKIESAGPVFYAAPRMGKKGRQFVCYKFRTMYADAELHKEALRGHNERRGATFKILNDARITPLGRVLRRYSLDELPQLWNVLVGEMSLVGPRPHPLDDCARYELEDLRRLDVAPGITGLWQVTAREDPSFVKNMALDLEYIENWSLKMDLEILFKTIPTVLAGTGA